MGVGAKLRGMAARLVNSTAMRVLKRVCLQRVGLALAADTDESGDAVTRSGGFLGEVREHGHTSILVGIPVSDVWQ